MNILTISSYRLYGFYVLFLGVFFISANFESKQEKSTIFCSENDKYKWNEDSLGCYGWRKEIIMNLCDVLENKDLELILEELGKPNLIENNKKILKYNIQTTCDESGMKNWIVLRLDVYNEIVQSATFNIYGG